MPYADPERARTNFRGAGVFTVAGLPAVRR
jgi:hypothetical protein